MADRDMIPVDIDPQAFHDMLLGADSSDVASGLTTEPEKDTRPWQEIHPEKAIAVAAIQNEEDFAETQEAAFAAIGRAVIQDEHVREVAQRGDWEEASYAVADAVENEDTGAGRAQAYKIILAAAEDEGLDTSDAATEAFWLTPLGLNLQEQAEDLYQEGLGVIGERALEAEEAKTREAAEADMGKAKDIIVNSLAAAGMSRPESLDHALYVTAEAFGSKDAMFSAFARMTPEAVAETVLEAAITYRAQVAAIERDNPTVGGQTFNIREALAAPGTSISEGLTNQFGPLNPVEVAPLRLQGADMMKALGRGKTVMGDRGAPQRVNDALVAEHKRGEQFTHWAGEAVKTARAEEEKRQRTRRV